MRNAFGAGLLGCGALLLAVFGLVLLLVAGGMIASGSPWRATVISLTLFGIPCGLGGLMVWAGRRQLRTADQEARDRVQSDVFD